MYSCEGCRRRSRPEIDGVNIMSKKIMTNNIIKEAEREGDGIGGNGGSRFSGCNAVGVRVSAE